MAKDWGKKLVENSEELNEIQEIRGTKNLSKIGDESVISEDVQSDQYIEEEEEEEDMQAKVVQKKGKEV